MSDDVSVKIAIALWVGLGVVALLYWTEWDKARREGRALPPHRHPVFLLASAAQILYRLWPLVAVGVASGIMATIRLHMWRQGAPGSWPEPSLHMLWPHLAQTLTTANWMLTYLVFSGLAHGAGASGPLVLAIAAAAGGWCAIANPWGLSKRTRLVAAFGVAGAIGMAASSFALFSFGPVDNRHRLLQMAQSCVWTVGASFTTALVAALLWWLGIRRRFDQAQFARGAQTGYLASVVVGMALAPLTWYPVWLAGRRYEFGAWQIPVSRDLMYLVEFAQMALIWVFWVAVSEGGSPLGAIVDGLRLAWWRRIDFVVLVVRVAVLLAPIRVLEAAMVEFPVPGMWVVRSAISSVVGVAFFTAAGLAYASLTDQFPSAVPQAGEEVSPPNLPGDIPIAH